MRVTARLLSLAAPIAGVHLLNTAVLTIDVAVVGRLDSSSAALAALAFASELLFLAMVGAIGLSVGAVALVSRAHGSGDDEATASLSRRVVNGTWLLGIMVALLGNLVAVPALDRLGADAETIDAALPYLRVMLAGSVLAYLNITLAGLLRGAGNTLLAFIIAAGVVALNIVLDFGLVLGRWGCPSFGIVGAAYASLIAHTVGVLAYVVATYLWRGSPLRLNPLPTLPTSESATHSKALWRISRPAILDLLVLELGFLAMVAMLGELDGYAVAAHAVGMRVFSLAFLPGLAISQASATMVGEALGAADPERARAVLRRALDAAVGVLSVLAVVILVRSEALVHLLGVPDESQAAPYAYLWLVVLGAGMPLTAVYLGYLGTLHGTGRTAVALRINLVSTLLVQLPLSWLLGFTLGMGPFGVWLGFPISYLPRALLCRAVVGSGRLPGGEESHPAPMLDLDDR